MSKIKFSSLVMIFSLCIANFSFIGTVILEASDLETKISPTGEVYTKDEAELIIEESYDDEIEKETMLEMVENIPESEVIVGINALDTSNMVMPEDFDEQTAEHFSLIIEDFNQVYDQYIIDNQISSKYTSSVNDIHYSIYNQEDSVIVEFDDIITPLIQNDSIDVIEPDVSSLARGSYSYVYKKYVTNTSWQKWAALAPAVGKYLPGWGKVIAVTLGVSATIASFIQVQKWGIRYYYQYSFPNCKWRYRTKWYTYSNYTGYINTSGYSYFTTVQGCK